jgi:L-asparaginase
MAIKLIITGGTIDKIYDESNGELTFSDTHIKQMLDQARCEVPVSIKNLMLIDSLDMVDKDRKVILNECKNSKESKIIITHGTDTMVETAKILGEHIQDKSIVLLGAMIPFSLNASDALFNIGCAINAVQCLQPGVYITMNGKIFTWDNVKKNKEKGIFENI